MNQGDLVNHLISLGYSRRVSQRTIQTFLDVIKSKLKDHESVELPFGTLEVRECPEEQRHWKLDKIVVQYRHRYRVWFKSKEI